MSSGFGQIIILNGVPRSGKSSIVAVIQDTFDGLWMNLGVDPKPGPPGLPERPATEPRK